MRRFTVDMVAREESFQGGEGMRTEVGWSAEVDDGVS